nr:hypothetical protein [Tanacetum cinerariifolium]
MLTPVPIICEYCDFRIPPNAAYHRSTKQLNKDTKTNTGTDTKKKTDKDTKPQHCICTACYKVSGSTIKLPNGGSISKAELQKAKNDKEVCDKRLGGTDVCIFGMYVEEYGSECSGPNNRCVYISYLDSVKYFQPERKASSGESLRTFVYHEILIGYLEYCKKRELQKAKNDKEVCDKVAKAEGLVVRVVLSVDKELEVKQQFRDIFEGKDYPEKLKYRSKRLGGVDVCICGMYVQEYGSECSGPNNHCVYISYLDSVKYFQPERKTSSGESLCTFVYHEILIGYLEYCKKQGFSPCYIWSCPVVKGQDYIFDCRPKT